MSDVPLTLIYNLGRLGQSGDSATLTADEEQRAGLAKFAGVVAVEEFAGQMTLKKLGPTRFELGFALSAAIVQACVVTLEPVRSRIARDFTRQLHFTPNLRRELKEVVLAPADDEGPEEIDSLHYDLAEPLVEEFLLAIDPYPRAPGVEFAPPEGEGDAAESPFAALKSLKSRG